MMVRTSVLRLLFSKFQEEVFKTAFGDIGNNYGHKKARKKKKQNEQSFRQYCSKGFKNECHKKDNAHVIHVYAIGDFATEFQKTVFFHIGMANAYQQDNIEIKQGQKES